MKKTVMLVCVLMCSAAAVSQAQTVLIPDFRVDNAPVTKYSGSPAIQSLQNDDFVIIWEDGRSGSEIYASIYNRSGVVIKDDYRVDDGAPSSWNWNTGPGGTIRDSNGNFFFTWLNSIDGTNYYGRIRKFYPNGDPVGASVDVDTGCCYTQVIKIAKGRNDQVIVGYGKGNNFYYRFFDNGLNPLSAGTQINQTMAAGSGNALATDSQGNYVVSWRRMDSVMIARLFDSYGNPRTDEFAIESIMSGGSDPQVIYNKYGHFCVVWWAALTYGMGRIFDENGNPLTNVFYLGPFVADPPEQYGVPAVDSDDNGNFIITYEYSGGTTPKRIYGTIYDSNGFVVEVFFPVSAVTVGLPTNVMETDVAYIGEGRFVTTWRDGRNDSNGDIYAAILQNDHWVPQPPGNGIPSAGPLALAILAVVLATILICSLKSRERKTRV